VVIATLVAALPAMVGAAVLRAVGFESAMELAPQVTGPPPIGSFHDIRWLLIYHDSWLTFVAELLAATAVRAGLNTVLAVLCWPESHPRPPWPVLLRSNLVYAAVLALVLSPWAAVAGAASDTSLSWFLFGELVPVVLLASVLQRGAATLSWWRGLPSLPAVGWSLAGVGLATVDAAVIGFTPGWWAVPVSGVAGAVNGLLWWRLIHAEVVARPRLPRVPVAPTAVVCTAGLLLAMSQYSVVGEADAAAPMPTIPMTVPEAVMYVAGYDSVFDGRPSETATPSSHFSYRGQAADGRPLPYGPLDTHDSLAVSAARLAGQVEALHQRTGRRVALIAQSEGTLVVRTYLQTQPHPWADAAVLLSPLVRPGRIYYPPRDAGSGWGIALGWELRAMLAVVRWSSGTPVSPDEPFARSVVDHGPLYRDTMLCPAPGLRVVAFLPTASAVVVPPNAGPTAPVVELPGLHASLLGRPDVQRLIAAFLNGGGVGHHTGWYYPVIQKAAAAWQAPALAVHVNPAWPARAPDVSFGQDGCAH
jgi:hypothetical protein